MDEWSRRALPSVRSRSRKIFSAGVLAALSWSSTSLAAPATAPAVQLGSGEGKLIRVTQGTADFPAGCIVRLAPGATKITPETAVVVESAPAGLAAPVVTAALSPGLDSALAPSVATGLAPKSGLAAAAPLDAIDADEILVGERDPAPLWYQVDPLMTRELATRLNILGFAQPIAEKRLAVAVVDITDLDSPRVAAVNGDDMIYAASLPKIAILLGAFERIHRGELTLDGENRALMHSMMQRSSNIAATLMMERVGKPFIAQVLTSPRYRLYDAEHNGGLWAGKDYGAAGLWQRDPLHNLSHAATVMQVARFFYMLETGTLVGPVESEQMKDLMSDSAIDHKFVKALGRIDPDAMIYRKSGTWQNWHADGAIVERAGHRYIAVGLCEDPQGGRWLERIFHVLDALVVEGDLVRLASHLDFEEK
ncbi:MAG: hypothetical protein FJ144_20825 [Deltaproteobacteria bacterium]|nr:hypothetical protein [Deltaproteobacteria bacterium]